MCVETYSCLFCQLSKQTIKIHSVVHAGNELRIQEFSLGCFMLALFPYNFRRVCGEAEAKGLGGDITYYSSGM